MKIGKISKFYLLVQSRKFGGKPTQIISSKKKIKRQKDKERNDLIKNILTES